MFWHNTFSLIVLNHDKYVKVFIFYYQKLHQEKIIALILSAKEKETKRTNYNMYRYYISYNISRKSKWLFILLYTNKNKH